jgi:hypothetical protein
LFVSFAALTREKRGKVLDAMMVGEGFLGRLDSVLSRRITDRGGGEESDRANELEDWRVVLRSECLSNLERRSLQFL